MDNVLFGMLYISEDGDIYKKSYVLILNIILSYLFFKNEDWLSQQWNVHPLDIFPRTDSTS